MGSPERSDREKVGTGVRNGGIIAGVIGLVLNSELFLAGIGIAAAGEIYKRTGKKIKAQ